MRGFHLLVLVYFSTANLSALGLGCLLFKGRSAALPVVKGLILGWPLLMGALILSQVFMPESWRPFWREHFYGLFSVSMFWNLILLAPMVLVMALIVAVRTFRNRQIMAPPGPAPVVEVQTGLTRRDFIEMAVVGGAPAVALGFGVHGALTRNDLRVSHLDLPVAGLPPDLEGFTITHLSDLHAGVFCGPERLRQITDAANDLKSDLVAVTGDVINDSLFELPGAMSALQKIECRRGVFVCEGNHDHHVDPEALERACGDAGLHYLSDSRLNLQVRGCNLSLSGLPWRGRHFAHQARDLQRLLPVQRAPRECRILLAHHPDLFDVTEGLVDVMLAGHTHGGQLMAGPFGFGPLLFRYWSGLYRRGAQSLVVSNGCGDWFPCRVGAPAEIAQLTLRRV